MVQRKVGNNKFGIQTSNNIIKTEKIKVYTKPSLQNHHDSSDMSKGADTSKGADMNGIKVKKSRSIEVGFRSSSKGGHDAFRGPGKPSPLGSSTPRTPSPCKSKSSDISPNYMKSTRSYEARKEERLQKVAKTLSRTSSRFKIVRTLSKVPSFKHCARTTTCSSTLKDSKFPRYLKLKPGATEAEGRSVQRVCSYNHCSLNGDHHNSAPPLKHFMSTRRRLLKTQKVDRPRVLSPRKAKCKGKGVQEQKEDFFVQIYVSDRGVDTQVSESLSDGPCSEIDQSEVTNVSDCPKDEDYPSTSARDYLEVGSSHSVSLDEFLCGNSDIRWEQEQICASENCDINAQSDYSNDDGKSDFQTGSSHGEYLERFHDYPPYFHDEIVEYLCFSDADSLPDSESTQTGERNIEELVMVQEKDELSSRPNSEVAEEDSSVADEATELVTGLEDESTDTKEEIIPDLIEEITEAQTEDLDSYQEPAEIEGIKSNEDYMIGEVSEEFAADPVMEERELLEEILDAPGKTEKLEISNAKGGICMGNNDGQDRRAGYGKSSIEELVMVKENDERSSGPNNEVIEEDSTLADEGTKLVTGLEDESTDTKGEIVSDLIEEITEAQTEDLDSYQEPAEKEGDTSNEDYMIGEVGEENATDPVMEEREPIEEISDAPGITEILKTSDGKEGFCMCNNDDRDGTDHSDNVAALPGQKLNAAVAEKCSSIRSENYEDEYYSSELDSNENDVEGNKTSGRDDSNRTEVTSRCIYKNRNSDAYQELDRFNKLKKGMRCMKADEDEERQFNPRGPNFLEIEPDPEAEKVDLRHQEMDDRRNAEEWMLDHALQKTVNQLTPARKKKVALLVEAYETVLPVAKDESFMKKDPSNLDHERPIQACS